MRAAGSMRKRDLRVEDVEIPQIRDGQVLIDTEWCGICGSDLHEYLVGKEMSWDIVEDCSEKAT